MKVTTEGVHDVPIDDYHADPVPDGSLSASGAKKLLPPSCPARFHHEREHPPAPTSTFDIGHAAHKLILGDGPELVVVDHDDWRTKAAKEARDEAHARGAVPLLARDHDQVQAMAAALREHPIVGNLFDADHGRPEQSLFWADDRTRVWRRARLDWLPDPIDGQRMIVADYKTCASADPDTLERAVHNYGYHLQAAWYLDGIHALGLADDAAFVFVFQEKAAPYLVTVAELDARALQVGRALARQAIDIYVECATADHWPGYSDAVELLRLPAWVENRYLQEASV